MLDIARDEAVDALSNLILCTQRLDTIIQPAVSRVVPEQSCIQARVDIDI